MYNNPKARLTEFWKRVERKELIRIKSRAEEYLLKGKRMLFERSLKYKSLILQKRMHHNRE